MKVRSAKLKAPWLARVEDVELPEEPPAGWVLLKVKACGICGSDLSAAQKNTEWKPWGHEIAGVVERVGSGVTNVKAGDAVTLESGSYCGVCDLCRKGRVDLCNKGASFWREPAMGFSEYMMTPACGAVKYAGLSAAVACLAEPAGVAYDMVKTAGIAMGDRVAIIGPGPIALMAIPMALRSGAGEVVCIGRSHNVRRLEVAKELGAVPLAIDDAWGNHKELEGRFEHVIVTSPVQTLPGAIPLLSYGGVLTYIGIGVGDGTISLDANQFHFRKLQLRASFASPAIYYPIVLDLLRAGIVPGDGIVSHRFRLEQIQEALTACREDKGNVVKVVVEM